MCWILKNTKLPTNQAIMSIVKKRARYFLMMCIHNKKDHRCIWSEAGRVPPLRFRFTLIWAKGVFLGHITLFIILIGPPPQQTYPNTFMERINHNQFLSIGICMKYIIEPMESTTFGLRKYCILSLNGQKSH